MPIETDIGTCHFIKVEDYPRLQPFMNYVKMSKLEIINELHKDNKTGKHDMLIEVFQDDRVTLFQISGNLPSFNEAYSEVFSHVFNDDTIMNRISEDNFQQIRQLVMRMNCMKEELINPNPEIQRAWERSKRVKAQDAEMISFSDMATSISVFGSKPSYNAIANLTIYQFFMEYQRIAQGFAYETATLFATVSAEKMKIDSWSKHIDLYQEERHELSQGQFNEIKKAF
ncbi:hypothetical protein [Terribacillus aidingensis]|nr:hypothetical protein [Terribacillus aidingensis]